MPGPLVTKDIEADMNYYKKTPAKPFSIDFTTPEGEKCLTTGVKRERGDFPCTIHDIRGQKDEHTLEKDGVQFVHQKLPDLDGLTDNEIVEILHPRAQDVVKKLTGATVTYVVKYRIRKLADKPNWNAREVQPAHGVHADWSKIGGLHLFEHRCPDPAEREKILKNGRVWIINVWRPLKTVTRDPLAWVDLDSVSRDGRDVQNGKYGFATHWVGTGIAVHNPDHRWKYLSHQKSSELLVFKQFDSKYLDTHGCTIPHSAVKHAEYDDEPPRESIEFGILAWAPEV